MEQKRSRVSVENAKSELQRALKTAHDNARLELRDAIEESREELVSMLNDIGTKKLYLENGKSFVRAQEEACEVLLRIYRDENQRFRKTESPPYFNRRSAVEISEIPEDNTTSDEQTHDSLERSLEDLLQRESGIQESLDTQIDQFRSRYLPESGG